MFQVSIINDAWEVIHTKPGSYKFLTLFISVGVGMFPAPLETLTTQRSQISVEDVESVCSYMRAREVCC